LWQQSAANYQPMDSSVSIASLQSSIDLQTWKP
jgi:hypothetical protein